MDKTLPPKDLQATITRILLAAGSLEPEAQAVAANLVMANLSGHDSHGVGMVPRYVEAVLEGGLLPNTSAKVVMDAGSLLTLDGQRGYGQIVGVQAMEMAIPRALAQGSCIVTLANAHHLGRIGHLAEMATAQGLVALHFVNVMSRPVVAPWGGSDGRFGTNPCCIGIPLASTSDEGSTRSDFILDFATSRVAQGKMRVAHNKGEQVAPGLLIDASGQPTTDPGVVVVPQAQGLFGALMPFGEHKGFGLAVACELLGGALSGGGTWHHGNTNARSVFNSMLTVLINPAKLGTQESFHRESLAYINSLRASPPTPGFEGVLIAGEPEARARAERSRNGIVLDAGTWAELRAAGEKVGVQLA